MYIDSYLERCFLVELNSRICQKINLRIHLQIQCNQIFVRQFNQKVVSRLTGSGHRLAHIQIGRIVAWQRYVNKLEKKILQISGGQGEFVTHSDTPKIVEHCRELIGARRLEQNAQLIVRMAQIRYQNDGMKIIVFGLLKQISVARYIAQMSEYVLTNVEDLLFFGGLVAKRGLVLTIKINRSCFSSSRWLVCFT